ncbi:hypothetical protein D3C87_1288270 [compost metagenome]
MRYPNNSEVQIIREHREGAQGIDELRRDSDSDHDDFSLLSLDGDAKGITRLKVMSFGKTFVHENFIGCREGEASLSEIDFVQSGLW